MMRQVRTCVYAALLSAPRVVTTVAASTADGAEVTPDDQPSLPGSQWHTFNLAEQLDADAANLISNSS
jgi:hypothetical protein